MPPETTDAGPAPVFETLLFEKDDGVALLTLNRPERRNAFDWTMASELRKAWEYIKAAPDIACVVVTAAGEKAFCTGVDAAAVASGGGWDQDAPTDMDFLHMTALQNECWKPVITAVNGMVCAGGLHFIADSDIIVCAEHATFLDTHVAIGLLSGLEPVGLARRIPLEAVMRIALLGGSERMTAEQALNLGLVGEVLPAAEVLPRAMDLARKIAKHSPTALAVSKRLIWQSLDVGLHEALQRTWAVIREHHDHPDSTEGPMAMLEKRAPRWLPYVGT